MTPIGVDRAARLLADLVAIPSVSPMGRPFTGTEPVERRVANYIEGIFRPFGLRMERQPCGGAHENLLVYIPGHKEGRATLFESHMDTVPAEDWPERAFVPRTEAGRLYGRGACDDKGSLAAMILAILDVLECGEKPPCPALLLAAGDEESSMTGIQRFIETAPPLARAVFGEPTSLCPIVQHKGIARWDITVHGKSAHSSQPELGCDAIAGAVQVLDALRRHQEELRNRQVNPRMSGPSITVTMIQGGRTRNALADQCTLSVDFRVLPGMSSPEARAELIASLSPLGLQLSHSDMQLCSPPLNTDPDGPFAQAVLEICRRATGQPHLEPAGVPYGTDAAWVSHLAPAVVLGPGSIEVAHAVDEFVDLDEVVQCARIYHEILMSET